jgi:GxxExxY protein
VTDILFKDESYAIVGACFEVYNIMGCGFLESVYQECLSEEFRLRNISFIEQGTLKLCYKTKTLEAVYKPDFICFESIIVEIKAINAFDDIHRAQVHNYLKATGLKLGLLINFGQYPKVQVERIARSQLDN